MLERKVPVDGGEVTVGRLSWSAWCRIKTTLAEALGNRLLATALSQIGDSADTAAFGQWLMTDAFRALPTLVGEVSSILDTLTMQLIAGCVGESGHREWSAFDILALRTAVLELNDFTALVRAEKNFIGEAVAAVAGRLASGETASHSGSPGSTSSPASTDGLPE